MNKELLFTAKGRATRTQFWLVHLAMTAVIVVAFLIITGIAYVSNSPLLTYGLMVLGFGIYGAAIWSSICLHIKRLHDLDLSGWLTIACFITGIGSLILGLWPAKAGPNQYGPNPKEI